MLGGMFTAPILNTKISAAADVAVTTSPAPLPAQVAGANGICVTAHPGNDAGSVIRVATNADATHGQPLGPGASWTFSVGDASALQACLEATATKALLIVTQA